MGILAGVGHVGIVGAPALWVGEFHFVILISRHTVPSVPSTLYAPSASSGQTRSSLATSFSAINSRLAAQTVCVCRSDPRLHDSRCRHGHGHWKEDALRLATVASEMDRKEWRPTCISAVSTQLTKCCGIGELPNLLTQPTPSHSPTPTAYVAHSTSSRSTSPESFETTRS